MKLHAYNKSSFSHTQALCRIVSRQRKRNVYSTCKKANILCVIQKMVEEESLTYSEASPSLGLDQSMISRWRKKEELFAAISRTNAFSLHSGPTSILTDITQDLLDFIDTWRSKGLTVNRIALTHKAQSLIPELGTKSDHAMKASISRFMKKHRLVHRLATHKAQRHPSKVEAKALQFLDYICPILQDKNRDPDFIMNMDQTPCSM
jgi:hypothetical protein